MDQGNDYTGADRRRNIRWSQAIAAGFKFVSQERKAAGSGRYSGIIHNISADGACLEIGELDEQWKDEIISGKLRILVEINLPGSSGPILALAKGVWISKLWEEKDAGAGQGKYLLGLNFTDITTASKDAITGHILKSYIND